MSVDMNIVKRVPMTQEEFDRFKIAALELYNDEWYADDILCCISREYGFEYESAYL